MPILQRIVPALSLPILRREYSTKDGHTLLGKESAMPYQTEIMLGFYLYGAYITDKVCRESYGGSLPALKVMLT